MDLKKTVDAAMVPTGILVAIGIITTVVSVIPGLNFLLCILGLPLLGLSALVLGWSGYRAVKEYKQDLLGGAVTGIIAGGASALINGIIGLLVSLLGIAPEVATGEYGDAAMGAGVAGVVGIIAIAFGMVFWVVVGAVMGAIGALVGERK